MIRIITFLKSKEARRYLENAKEILRKAPFEDNTYTDIKSVQEAYGTSYFTILKTIHAVI